MVVAWIDPAAGAVQFCRAGQRVLLGRIHADGSSEELPADDSPPAGRVRTAAYETRALTLKPGDTLVLASDGAKTAVNSSGEVFGCEGLRNSLCDGVGNAPGQVLSELAADLREHTQSGRAANDVTVVLALRP
jgi:serine phosphatase RsbU (regulator of sigma subunit)